MLNITTLIMHLKIAKLLTLDIEINLLRLLMNIDTILIV